jgi:hypothetical protein
MAKTAVVVKGNPRFVEDARVKKCADTFYEDIAAIMEARGYAVAFDRGEPYTTPPNATVWIGHSRGVDRLRFAPAGVKTVALTTMNNDDGYSPQHYVLSKEDVAALNQL